MSTMHRSLHEDSWFVVPAGAQGAPPKGWQAKPPKGAEAATLSQWGAADPLQGAQARRFVCSFTLDTLPDSPASLKVDRLTGTASFWLNGQALGACQGVCSPSSIDTGKHLAAGPNLLAVEIAPLEDAGEICDPCLGRLPATALTGAAMRGVSLSAEPAHPIVSVSIQPDIRRNRIACIVKTRGKGRLDAHIDGVAGAYMGDDETFSLDFEKYVTWSPETPQLYQLVLVFTAATGHREELRAAFGMREFSVKDQRFHLNGRPYFVHGVAYAPADSTPESLREDLQAMKAAGFNWVQIDQAALSADLLQAADGVGMLISCGLIVERPKESQAFHDELKARFQSFLEPLLNHPSLAAFSLGSAALTCSAQEPRETLRRVRALVPGLRSLDPSRLIFVGQGTSALTGEHATYVRPYRDEGESYVDVVYRGFGPHTPLDESFLRHVGDEELLNFASSITSFGMAEASIQDGATAETDFDATFPEQHLERVFDTPEAFRRGARALQSAGVVSILAAARGNRTLAGYCYAQWRDSGLNAGYGLRAVNGEARVAERALQELQVSMRPIIVIQRTNLMVREETSVQVLLTNLERAEGRVELSLQVVGPTNQVLWKKKRSVKLPKHGRELWSGTIAASGSTGKHRFIVRVLQNFQRIAESGADFTVLDEVKPAEQEIHLLDPERRHAAALGKYFKLQNFLAPVHIIPPLANTMAAYPDNELLQMLAQVKGGAVAIFFNPPADFAAFMRVLQPEQPPLDLLPVKHYDAAYHYNRIHPVFDHLPAKTHMGFAYRYVQPDLVTAGGSDEDICGSWLERGAGCPEGRHSIWGAPIASRRHGSGRIIVCTLRVLESLDFDPLAQHLIINLVAHFTRRSIPPTAPLTLETQPVEWMRRSFVGDKRKWLVIGEFAHDTAKSGHTAVYPPEREIDLNATYPGWYRPVYWQPWFSSAAEGHRVNFNAAIPGPFPSNGGSGGGSWYAYAEFSAEHREKIRLRADFCGSLKIWLNGAAVLDELRGGGENRCAEDAMVRQGRNTVLIKCSAVAGPAEATIGLENASGLPLSCNWWR
ncbi:MAG: hypothetical protein HYV27_03495 [Candidatus Hydrogenedentes bacterium]|nr:hypothetical protein [Candidatus Hydrogenedentota bacterium]